MSKQNQNKNKTKSRHSQIDPGYLFDLAHKQCNGIIKGWFHYLTSESKGRFLFSNILMFGSTYHGSDSIITSRPGGRWFHTFFVILRDGKLGGGWYLIKVCDVTVKKISMKFFCIIKEKIACMECVIQSSMFYSFYLFLSILLCNIDSALVSDSNAYIWISNYIQMFEFIFEIFLLILLSFLNPKILFFIGKGGGVCAVCVTERKKGFVKKRDKAWWWGVGGSKKAILAWRNYWIAPWCESNFL